MRSPPDSRAVERGPWRAARFTVQTSVTEDVEHITAPYCIENHGTRTRLHYGFIATHKRALRRCRTSAIRRSGRNRTY